MAKDGTMRGGPRPNTGQKKKALADKLLKGKAELDNGAVVLLDPVQIEGVDMPPIKYFLKAKQKNGKDILIDTMILIVRIKRFLLLLKKQLMLHQNYVVKKLLSKHLLQESMTLMT